MKHPAPHVAALVAIVGVACTTPAFATGWVRIQQSDNTVQKYEKVFFEVSKKGLTFISADKYSTALIQEGECEKADQLTRCTGKVLTLTQSGSSQNIKIDRATFYFNLTDQAQSLPMSSLKLDPHSVMFAMKTAKGTFVTGSGTLDKEEL